jgi:hypothetical protein
MAGGMAGGGYEGIYGGSGAMSGDAFHEGVYVRVDP